MRELFRRQVFLFFLLVFIIPLSGADFGLSLIQTPELSGASSDNSFSWEASAAPWVSAVINEKIRFYASGALGVDYNDERPGDYKWLFIPELYRLEGIIQFMPGRTLTLGRTDYQDGLGFIVKGNFDGFKFSAELGQNRFSLGAFYTGLQYKENASIVLTAEDYLNLSLPLDFDDADSYFASRRGLFFLRGEFPGLLTERGILLTEFLGQFDFTDSERKFHSQYLTAAYRFGLRRLDLIAGMAAELMETEDEDPALGFAASLDLKWAVPTSFQDTLDLGARWATGDHNDTLSAFTPISSISQSYILKPPLSGLLIFKGGYEFRLLQTLSIGFDGFYFIQTGSDSNLWGPELYGRVNWAPVTDFSLAAGGGAFFPGPDFDDGSGDSRPRWLLSLTTTFSL
jgi:hypothetical protein